MSRRRKMLQRPLKVRNLRKRHEKIDAIVRRARMHRKLAELQARNREAGFTPATVILGDDGKDSL